MSARYEQDSGAARTVVAYLSGAHDGGYSGVVSTPHGFVRAHGFPPDQGRDGGATYLDLVYAGRWYRRRWERLFTLRGVAVAAGRFSREIAAASRGGL